MKKKSLFYIFTPFFIASLFISGIAFSQSEAQLKEELAKLEQEIKAGEVVSQEMRQKINSINDQLNKINAEFNKVQKNIDVKNSVIKELGSDINIKDQTVGQLNNKLDRSTDVLAEIIRSKNKIDDVTLFEIVTAYDNISDFFVGVDSINKIQKSIDDLLDEIRELRGLTEEEKKKLEEKKQREQEIKAKIELEKKAVVVKQVEQKGLLATSKAEEQAHEKELAAKRAKAAAIRSELFRLRDTGSLTFEQAQTYAESASRATGVRAAFILGILKQETNIGQYLGSCVITDLDSAAMKNVKTGTTYTDGIHPTRDLPTLKSILSKLGRDPLKTLVSCPQSFGYGGAMGPSQFIPSTWKLYENRIAQTLGSSVADPWNAQHAIMGTALLLKDNGAIAGSTESERNAACKYYSGQSCAAANTAIASYGNSVMSHTAGFQANIDFLKTVE